MLSLLLKGLSHKITNFIKINKHYKAAVYFDFTKNQLSHNYHTNYAMGKVYLRRSDGEEQLHISFRYCNNEQKVDREFNFCRNVEENVDDALVRIRNNVEKEIMKKTKSKNKKKPKSSETALDMEATAKNVELDFPIPVELLRSDKSIITNITFSELLQQEDKQVQLRILDSLFDIVINEPWIINLVLPTSIMAGFLVYPSRLELKFAEQQHSKAIWYKAKKPPSGDLQKGATWLQCAEGFFYQTSNEDIGHYLKLFVMPGNVDGQLGPPVEYISKNEVQASPGICPFESRNSFTKSELKDGAFRVVSYNLLADLYADSAFSREQLFPYCPAYALRIDYRKQLFLKEIISYNADLICLQEVDVKIFESDLQPVLAGTSQDFAGVMTPKGQSGEGVALFYRKKRFELLESYALNIGANIKILPEFAQLWQKIKSNEKLVERICDRAQTLQLNLLRCKENQHLLLVANTHLYFHPDADHIRLLQIGFSMLYVEHIYKLTLLKQKCDEKQLALIFCGDFNSVPECGIYKLLTQQFVDEHCIDWSSNEEQTVQNVSLTQPFVMQSACGTPPFTNYTHLFAACLDYIFYQSDRLKVQQVVPLPSEEELKQHIAIPSVVFPSDHVALVADLEFLAKD